MYHQFIWNFFIFNNF